MYSGGEEISLALTHLILIKSQHINWYSIAQLH